ncbi:hypothetical protein BUALT_Bualt05G0038200 [Buddleja alternifolia]|uniref:Mitochondrial transcription termination factor n=1 Tax=Buddleja alternifolia TaxID=168488 RepID=A0AAV6XPA1_9LAMI|nr:hypothetical protein BUALT_Bualt05G0038200 [Buddleja alternifolia]
MIIKSIFRRYEKWNPVHPTHGAFWGIGVGIGCGVGWGPGFGPEVVGYVGSGCGVGFSVGITFLGLGIGLPANRLLEVPLNGRGALDVVRAGGLLGNRTDEQQYPFESFPSFKIENWRENIVDLPHMKSILVSRANHITDCLQGISRRIFPSDKGDMESSSHGSSLMWFFKDRGFDDKSIHEMSKKYKRLEDVNREKASENWDYLKSIGIHERKLPTVIGKCPKILTLDLHEKLVPMVQCLSSLETKPKEVASAITKFPHILLHSLEEKLCPLLAFFEALGAPEKQLGKMLLLNPRIISYSIESKLSQTVDFLASLGMSKDGMIGKVLVKHPYIMGYSVDKRLRPTSEFLKSLGLTGPQLQRVAINFPEVMSRDADKILRPNAMYLQSSGFDSRQIAALVAGYPPVLIKSVSNSVGPRIKFLKEVMGRRIEEIVEYPEFFKHGLKKRLELRHKFLKQKHVDCSLSEMLDCNQKKFMLKFGLMGQ